MRSVGEVVSEVVDQFGDEEHTSFGRMHPVGPNETPVPWIVGAIRAIELSKHRCGGNPVLGSGFSEELLSVLPVRVRHLQRVCGKLILDHGAQAAVTERGKSLLPSGIYQLEGTFERGDAVRICDLNGIEFAKGVTNYTSAELVRILGKKTKEIEGILGYQYGDEVVHRDNMVINT